MMARGCSPWPVTAAKAAAAHGHQHRTAGLLQLLLLLHLLACSATGAAAVTVGLSQHSCAGDDPQTRLCRFSNLVVANGQILYVSDKPVQVPAMSGYRPGYKAYGPPIEVVSSQRAQQLVDTAKSVATEEKAVLVFRMHYENWGHHVLDITATTHRVLCSTLQLCTHDAASLQQLRLVFFDHFPKQTGNFQRIWGCYSSQPPVYVKQPDFKDKAYVLKDVAAGWRYLSLFDLGWGDDAAHTYYNRVWRCLGLDTSVTVHGLKKRHVTFIQRPFYESKKARSFVNVHDLVPLLQQRHPEMTFAVQTLGNKPFEQVVSTFHNSSIVFAVNGAAMGNALFMRKGAVYVDIGPVEWHWDFIGWTFRNLAAPAQVKVLKYSVRDPQLKPLRWELIAKSPQIEGLSQEEIVRLLREHKCPASVESHCKADWLYTKADFILAPHAAEHWLSVALEHISSYRAPASQ